VLLATAPQRQLIGKKITSSNTASVALGQIPGVPNFVNGSGEQPGCYHELS
jgi:hypothetical protein